MGYSEHFNLYQKDPAGKNVSPVGVPAIDVKCHAVCLDSLMNGQLLKCASKMILLCCNILVTGLMKRDGCGCNNNRTLERSSTDFAIPLFLLSARTLVIEHV